MYRGPVLCTVTLPVLQLCSHVRPDGEDQRRVRFGGGSAGEEKEEGKGKCGLRPTVDRLDREGQADEGSFTLYGCDAYDWSWHV